MSNIFNMLLAAKKNYTEKKKRISIVFTVKNKKNKNNFISICMTILFWFSTPGVAF